MSVRNMVHYSSFLRGKIAPCELHPTEKFTPFTSFSTGDNQLVFNNENVKKIFLEEDDICVVLFSESLRQTLLHMRSYALKKVSEIRACAPDDYDVKPLVDVVMATMDAEDFPVIKERTPKPLREFADYTEGQAIAINVTSIQLSMLATELLLTIIRHNARPISVHSSTIVRTIASDLFLLSHVIGNLSVQISRFSVNVFSLSTRETTT